MGGDFADGGASRPAQPPVGSAFDELEFAMPPDQLARIAAMLWLMGAAMGFAGSLLPHGSGVDTRGWLVLSMLAVLMAGVSLVVGVRRPMAVQYLLAAVALGAISFALLCAHHTPTIYLASSLYVLLSIYAAIFFATEPYIAYLVAQTASSAVIFLTSGLPTAGAAWLVCVGTATTVGVVVHILRNALSRAATADPLTGLANRRAFESMLTRELANSARTGEPVCVAVFDLDHFKEINDAGGHHEGDRVLIEVSRHWSERIRPRDVLVRSGGDEFVLLMPGATAAASLDVLQRLRATSTHRFSAGLAQAVPGAPMDDLLRRADDACYEAKAAGGDCVVAAELTGRRQEPPGPTRAPEVDPGGHSRPGLTDGTGSRQKRH